MYSWPTLVYDTQFYIISCDCFCIVYNSCSHGHVCADDHIPIFILAANRHINTTHVSLLRPTNQSYMRCATAVLAEIARSDGGTQIWRPRTDSGGLLELKRSKLRLLKFTLKISYAGCPGLSPVMSAQFVLKICATAWNREKFAKNPLFLDFKVIQCHRWWYPGKARQQCLLW